MDQQRWHLYIEGRVQGVYYRASAKYKAIELGLTGYARNMPDGTVEIVAEGKDGALEQLLDWCWQGPVGAEVKHIRCEKAPADAYYEDFQIKD